MRERRRILFHSIGALVSVSVSAAAIAVVTLYTVSLENYKARLVQLVQRRANLIREAGHMSPQPDPGESSAGTDIGNIGRIVDIYEHISTFDATGEFSIGRLEGDDIDWLLRGRETGPDAQRLSHSDTGPSGPMRRAIRGESGTLIGRGSHGERVLAGYEPIPELGWGVVATIDMAEINAPFVRAGLLAAAIGLVVMAGGVALMLRVTSPLVERIESRVRERTALLDALNASLRTEVNERRQTEAELRRMSKVFMDAAVPILLLDLSGGIVDVNAEAERTYGWTRAQLLDQSLEIIMPPESYSQQQELLERCIRGEAVQNVESSRQTKSGKRISILLTLSRLTDENGAPVAVASIAKDLSQQRRLQRQLRAAGAEAALTEERERRKLAVELHDGLGQLLALISVKLGMLRNVILDSKLTPQIRELENFLSEAHALTSSLSFQLSPPILHDVGIVPAAEWLADDIEKRFNLVVSVQDDGQPKPLDEATRITLFRGLSELLVNVARHAQVNSAIVNLWREGDVVGVCVEDQGIGFVADESSDGYGLLSIRERLNHLGGSVQIESEPGMGSRIILVGPIARSHPQRDLRVL
jgi:PAS domain S-box-containing protein